MCFRIEKHIVHPEVRAVWVLFCVRANTKKHATLFYSLLISVRARVFCASLTSPALENTIERIYQKHDVNYVLRQFLAVNYSPLLEFFWNWETYKITEKLNRKKKKKLKPIFIIAVGCYVFHFLFINLLRNYFFKQCSSVIVKTTAHICSNGVNWLSY